MPVGDYTRRLLRRLHLSSILSSNTVSQETNVGHVTSKVALGSADAGFVYVTDGAAAGDRRACISLPQLGAAAGALRDLRGPALRRRHRAGRRRSSAGCARPGPGAGAQALRLRPAAARLMAARARQPRCWRSASAITLDVPGAAAGGAVHAGAAARRAVAAGRAGRAGRARGDRAHEPRRQRADPGVRHADRVDPRDAALPRPGAGGDAVELPLVLPPAVAGIGLLAAFGGGGLVGAAAAGRGHRRCRSASGRWSWRSRSSPRRSTCARRSPRSRASTRRCRTPRARSAPAPGGRSGGSRCRWPPGGLAAGWVLAFARGVGEFGATIIFAGNVHGQTQTLTLAVYEQLESELRRRARDRRPARRAQRGGAALVQAAGRMARLELDFARRAFARSPSTSR